MQRPGKLLAVLLTLLLAVQLCGVFPAYAANLDTFSETFQNYTAGTNAATLTGWSVGEVPDATKVNTTIAEDPNDSENRVMQFYDVASNVNNASTLSFSPLNGENSSGIVTVQYNVALGAMSKNSRISLKSGSSTIGSIFIYSGCNCGLALSAPSTSAGAGGSASTKVLSWGSVNDDGTYQLKNSWQTVTFMLDFNTKTFSVYLNGTQGGNGAFASADVTALDGITVTTENSSNAAIYLDDIYIAEGTDLTQAGWTPEQSELGYTWENVPVGAHGFVTGVVIHPTEPDLVYARTDVGGAYRWDAANETWIPLNDMFTTSQTNLFGIDGIAIDPNNPDIVYLAAGKGTWEAGDVLKSYDRGESWVRCYFPNAYFNGNGGPRGMGECIMVDPNNSNIVYVGTANKGLWRSTDGGGSWTKVIDTTKAVRNVVVDKNTASGGISQTVYAGVNDTGLFRSTDGGFTWAQVTGSPATVKRMEVSPTGKLYVAASNGLFKYDAGAWTDISPQSGTYNGISLDPQNENVMVCLGPQTSSNTMKIPFWKSEDGGQTWTNKASTRSVTSTLSWEKYTSGGKDFASNAHCILIDPHNSNRVWISDFFGVFKTENINAAPTQSWSFLYRGMEETVPRSFICPPTGNYPLIAAIADIDGLVYSDTTQYADRMIRANRDAPWMMSTSSIDYCEEDPNLVVRVGINWNSAAKAEVSTNGTNSWTNISFKKKSDPSSTYGVSKFGMVAMSSTKNPATGKPAIVVIPQYGVPLVSDDLGATWEQVSGITDNTICTDYWNKGFHLTADKVDGSTFYIQDRKSGSSKCYVSTDWGKTWTVSATLGGGHDVEKTYIKAVPTMEGEVWSCVGGSSLYHSSDRGATFAKFNNISEIECFGFGKNKGGVSNPTAFIYAKVDGVKGIFRSIDMGETWERINDKNTPIGCSPKIMEGDMRTFGVVYLGTDGRGIFAGRPDDIEVEPSPDPSIDPTPTPTPTPSVDPAGYYYENFERYETGSDVNGQNGWTTTGESAAHPDQVYVTTATDPTADANKVLQLYDTWYGNVTYDNAGATAAFEKRSGSETNGIVTVQYKMMVDAMSKQSKIFLKDGDKTLSHIFINPSASCGITYVAPSESEGAGGANTSTHLIWGVQHDNGEQYLPDNTWYTLKYVIDFNNETIDVYLNDSKKLTSSFASADCTGIDSIQFSTSNDSIQDLFIDEVAVIDGTDFSVIDPPVPNFNEDFEAYDSDAALDGQNGWTTDTSGTNFDPEKVEAALCQDPTDSGNQVLHLYDMINGNVNNANASATASFDKLDGHRDGNLVTVQYRMMVDAMSKQSRVTLKDGDKTLSHIFINPSASCGITYVAPSVSEGAGGAASYTHLTWGVQHENGEQYLPDNTWYTLKYVIDFSNETIDVYMNDSYKLTSSFASADCTGIDTIQFSTRNDSPGSIYFDDVHAVQGVE